MRVAALSATAALVLATLAGSVAPAAADTPAGPVLQVPWRPATASTTAPEAWSTSASTAR